jgi:hypothetical protein
MIRLLYAFIFILFTFQLTASAEIVEPTPRPHPMIPFTSPSDMVMCSEVMDIEKVFSDSLACSLNSISPDAPVDISDEKMKELRSIIDNCFVLTPSSPDVYSTDEFNYVNRFLFFGSAVLGFYDPQIQVTYITQNIDSIEITEHEVQHHILNVLGIEDGDHTHSVWSDCRPPRYTPSEEAKKGNPYKKPSFFNKGT